MELSNVFDCEKGIAKQLKILKVIEDNRLRQRRSFVFAVILLIIRHSCQSFYVILLNKGLAIRRPLQEENLRVSKTKNKFCKIFDEFKFRIHILHIFTN